MNILFLTHYTALYGSNKSLLTLLLGLKLKGVAIIVIIPDEGPLAQELKRHNIAYRIINIRRWINKSDVSDHFFWSLYDRIWSLIVSCKRWLNNKKLLPELKNIIDKFDISLIYTNSAIVALGATLAYKYNIPHIWHIREFGDKDFHLKWDFGLQFSKWYINRSEILIANSIAVKNHFQISFSKKMIHVIYNGIETEQQFEINFRKYIVKEKNEAPFIFTIVGSIQKAKGQDIAIKAYGVVKKHYFNTQLIVAGTGETTHLEKLAREEGVFESVIFTGHVNDPYEVYEKAHVVLMCSPNEAMGRVTLEAMACKRAVIGYDNAGTTELIHDKKTGLLYKGGYKELAAKMILLIENDELRTEISEAGFDNVRKNFTNEKYVNEIHELISAIRL